VGFDSWRRHHPRDAVWVAVVQGSRGTGEPYFTRVARIDPTKRKRVALVDVSSLGTISDLAVRGKQLWVAGFDESSRSLKGAVLRIDPATSRAVKRIPFTFPRCLAAGTGGVWVSSATSRSGTVSRIDPTSNRVAWTASVGDDPCGIVEGRGSVWAANSFKTADTSDPPLHNRSFRSVVTRASRARTSPSVTEQEEARAARRARQAPEALPSAAVPSG
jgi:DNA-binding beta-propeller fold protein YncE